MIELIQGHALDVLERMAADSMYDAVITDPPYASGASTQSGVAASTATKYTSTKRGNCPFPDFEGDAMDKRSWANLMTRVLTLAREHTHKGGVIVLFADWRQAPVATDASEGSGSPAGCCAKRKATRRCEVLQGLGTVVPRTPIKPKMQWAGWIWRGIVAWDKGNCRPHKGRFRQQAEFVIWGSNGALPVDRPVPCLPGVFAYPNVTGAARLHQTQKPLALMRELVRICLPGGRILDPFAGSGTTLEAANLEGFDATGIELSKPIYATARKRLRLDS